MSFFQLLFLPYLGFYNLFKYLIFSVNEGNLS